MDYTIYSIGETEFLFAVLNGIVRIFDTTVSGFASYIAIASLLMLLGGLLAKIFNDKTTPIKDWIFGLIFFFILAGPMSKVDVELIGVRDGSVYTVDDVPLFAALGGYLATSLSHLLANDFKQSFQTINPTSGGLDPLRALQQVQNVGMSQNQIPGVTADYDPIGSIQNYIKNCFVAQYLINKGSAYKQTVLKSNPLRDGWDAIHVNDNTLQAYVFLGSGGEFMGCRDAHALIDSLFFQADSGFKKVMDDYFQFTGVDANTFVDSFNNILVANDPGSTAASAYDAAAGIFLNNQLLIASSSGDSVSGYYDSVDRERFTARHNRLYTMASERGMWMEMSVGMVTILESFVFFIAPIMAIMLVMGGMGLKALVTYFGLTVWVNFWPITMTFVNLYTEMSIAGKFASLEGAAGSFGMFDESMTTIESSIAFASQLTAMIPMLTLFVLYRGVHTMMGVASQTSANSFSGQSAGQGSLVKGEAGNYTSGNTQHQVAGAGSGNSQSVFSTNSGNMPGMRNLGASFSTSGGSSTDLANQASNVSSKKAAHGEALQKLSNQAISHSNQNMSGEEIAASSNKSTGVAAKVASSFKDGDAVKQQEVFKALMAIDGKISGGLSGGVKADSGLSGSASINASAGLNVSDVIAQIKESGVTLSTDQEDAISQSLTKQITASQSWKNTDTDTEQNSISTAYSQLQKRETAYEDATRQQAETSAKFANQSVANITSQLEQGASSVRLSSDTYTDEQIKNNDTESSYISNAVLDMDDNEAKAWAKGLGLDDSTPRIAREGVNDRLQSYQNEEFDKVARDTTYSGRSDHEGIAVHQAVLRGFKEVSENVGYDPSEAKSGEVAAVSAARINESANELRGLGQIYKSFGEDDRVKSANLATVGGSLMESADSLSQAVKQEESQKVSNNTDVVSGHEGKLLDEFKGDDGKPKSFSAQTMGNYLKGTVQTLNQRDTLKTQDPTTQVNQETKVADNVLSEVGGNIAKEKATMETNMESLKTSALKLAAIQNQMGGMKDSVLDLTASSMDFFGGSAGPEEKIAAMAAYTDAPLSPSMVRGFDLLSEKNDLEVKDILKHGLNPDSDQYYDNKKDAMDISVASSAEGQELYKETIGFWGSQSLANNMTSDEKEKFGDGVDTDKWAQISTNLNKLNDNDRNKDGKITDNERGLTHQLANSPETKMATLSHHAVVTMADQDGTIPSLYEPSYKTIDNNANSQLANVIKNDAYLGHINETAERFGAELPSQAKEATQLSPQAAAVGLNEIYGDVYNGDAHYNHNMEAALVKNGTPTSSIRSMDREHATETIKHMDKSATQIENLGYPEQADRVRDRATVLQSEHHVTSEERFGKDLNKEDQPKRR